MPANFANSQTLVEIEQIKDSTLILKDGSLRQILMVSGMNFALKSEDEQNAISSAYANFLNSVDFGIQIIVHSRKINIEKYLADLDQKKAAEQSPQLRGDCSGCICSLAMTIILTNLQVKDSPALRGISR